MRSPERRRADDLNEYVGVLHIHTRHSDGAANLTDIVAAARATGVDFVLISDHDSLGAREQGWEGWHQDVLVLVGVEISPRRDGHCLALGVDECSGYRDLEASEYLRRVAAQDGLAFAAHPAGRLRPLRWRRTEVWSEWCSGYLAGMEIWSFLHAWSEGMWPWGIHRVPLHVLTPTKWLRGPAPETLEQWDRIGRERRFVGIGSVDAHEVGVSLVPWRLVSNRQVFRTIRTHIHARRLTRDKERDLRTVREALENGRCHVANDLVCDSKGFSFWGETPSQERVRMGDEVACEADLTVGIRCPAAGEIVLLRDGIRVESIVGSEMETRTSGPGVYRVEVARDGQPWVFSNPIYLRDVERS